MSPVFSRPGMIELAAAEELQAAERPGRDGIFLFIGMCVCFFCFNGYCVYIYIYMCVIIYVIYIYMFFDFHGNIWNFYDTL